jgi:hypothetical protein
LTEDQLPILRSTFAKEVKRNLFEAYLRPRETVVNLVSTSISSSAAFPGGEAFHFAFSPKGHHVLAYSSSRIYVINTTERELAVKRELKILRRPASVAILDDGSLLAVLSTDHQVDIYDLTEAPPKHIRALELDHAPRTISLAPMGSVLAAAYDAGVEVYSLAATASLTDRRSVKCDAADSLLFSQDGTQLLGTTLNSRSPNTVILTAPYFDPGDCAPEESVSQLWTTSILFPHSSRDCSHAILLPSPLDDEASWAFTYDRVFETFRAVRIDDLRNGTTYFTGPTPDLASGNKLLPTTLPTTTGSGDLVAAGFQGKEIWLYGVPEDLDSSSDMNQSTILNVANEASTPTSSLARSNSAPSVRSHTWPRDSTSNRIPQWQLLSDKSRNTLIEGRNISSLQGISALKWVTCTSDACCSERLVVVAPGVVGQLSEAEDDGMAPIDGGRLSILDFDYQPTNGDKCTITIEVGGNEPEVLEEEHRDMETEVAIVRRRTVAQKGQKPHMLRSATVASRPPPSSSNVPARLGSVSAITPMPPLPSTSSGPRVQLSITEEQPETASIASADEAQEALDAPYAHGSPRSGTTLRRAATAAAINRRLHPTRVVAQEHIQYRRADGREEHPHESDADNWVPPPPPYTREPIAPLPEHLRNAVLVGTALNTSPTNIRRSSTHRSSGSTDSTIINALHRSRSTFVPSSEPGRRHNFEPQRSVSDPTSLSHSDDSLGSPEAVSQGDTTHFDELYDVSPPDSPDLEPTRPAVSATAIPGIPIMPSGPYQIPRRPVPSAEPGRNLMSTAPDSSDMHSESPVSQPTVTDLSQRADSRTLQQWEGIAEPSRNLDVSRPSTGSSLTQTRLDVPVPLRSNDDHRLTELPPSTPTKSPPSSPPDEHVQPVESNRPSSLQVETTPGTGPTESAYDTSFAGFSGPSPSQLARLNSRSGRPPSRVLNDPSRRGSGTFAQPNSGSPIHQNSPIARVPVPNAHPRAGSQPYRQVWAPPTIPTIPASPDSPAHSPAGFPQPNTQYRQGGFAPVRQTSSSTPNLRPRVQRLDTIHSVTSQGEPATYVRSLSMMRKTSRAGKSAAINIEQAKRRGWGGTRKEKRKRDRDGASSAGWTDVTRDSYGDETKKKGSKCVVM